MDAPVIVVGGGPVGLALALGLAHHGVRSIVLERTRAPRARPGAVALSARAIEVLRDWSAADALLSSGTYYSALTVYDAKRDRPLVTLDFMSLNDELERPGTLIAPQAEIEHVLRGLVLDHPLCDLRRGCTVAHVTQDSDGVTVHLERDGAPATLRAAYVAGCDGPESTVRSAVGIATRRSNYGVRAIVSDAIVADDDPFGPSARMLVDYPGLLLGVRFAPGTWRIAASLAREADLAAALEPAAIQARLDALFDRRVEVRTIWQDAFELSRTCAERFALGRVVLAGDAAHRASPIGGEGLNCGVADTANLAWKLAYALEGRGDPDALLESYDRERRQAIAENSDRTTDRVTRFAMELSARMRKLALRGALRMLRERGMQRKISRAFGLLSGRYTESALIDNRHPMAGARIDDVLLPNGTRLSRARGGRAALVAVGKVPLDGLRAIRVPLPLKRWVLRTPAVAIVRPDGVVAAIVERPTRERVATAWRRAFAGERLPD